MKIKALAKRPTAARSIFTSSIQESPEHQLVSSRRSVSGVVAPAEQLNSPDTVCLAVTGTAGKKTLAHPGRATTLNCLASITFVNASSRLPINSSAVRFVHRNANARHPLTLTGGAVHVQFLR
jgi:hypothetical protein